ncbi:hypothetical protein NL676_013344 [Syzygium grande]|nr:hypothetical protein NL676_013344 [Syzygium grande]
MTWVEVGPRQASRGDAESDRPAEVSNAARLSRHHHEVQEEKAESGWLIWGSEPTEEVGCYCGRRRPRGGAEQSLAEKGKRVYWGEDPNRIWVRLRA